MGIKPPTNRALESTPLHRLRRAGIALGGVAHKPWRAAKTEQALSGKRTEEAIFRAAAEAELAQAMACKHNAYKIELANRSIVRALTTVAAMA